MRLIAWKNAGAGGVYVKGVRNNYRLRRAEIFLPDDWKVDGVEKVGDTITPLPRSLLISELQKILSEEKLDPSIERELVELKSKELAGRVKEAVAAQAESLKAMGVEPFELRIRITRILISQLEH